MLIAWTLHARLMSRYGMAGLFPFLSLFFFFQFKSPELEVFQDHSSSTQEMLVLIS